MTKAEYMGEERRKIIRKNNRIFTSAERSIREFWEYFIEQADNLPDWTEFAVPAVTFICCISLCTFLFIEGAHAQQRTQDLSAVQVQQAIISTQVINNATEIVDLKKDVQYNRDRITVIADEVATMRGVGIGISFVLGLLQAIQILLQVKTKPAKA